MSITLKDIALQAGVDVSTVSRSLAGRAGIHKETREKVLAVAARLNYRPNRVARGLITGRTNTLALLVSDIRNPYFAEVARGAEDAARSAGCDLLLCNADFDPAKQMDYVRLLEEKRVDGILINSVANLSRQQLEQLAGIRIPIVLLNRVAGMKEFSSVAGDNVEGGRLVAEYLLRLGHRHIAHLTGPRSHVNLADRWKGFERGCNGRVEPLVLHGENSFEGGYELTRKLLERSARVTAIFAANDAMAFGVARALVEAGIRVPEQVSLVGFDNVDLAQVVQPPLTTIHQPKCEMGQAAVEMLLRMAEQGVTALAEHRVLGVRLIERASCAPLVKRKTA